MSQSDLQTLGLSPGATTEQIKRAYRLKVKQCHPDLFPGDAGAEARMVELQKAYERALAETERSGRISRMFAAHPAAGVSAFSGRIELADNRRTQLISDRLNQCVQTVLLLLVLVAPFAAAALGGALLTPYLSDQVQERSASIRRGIARSKADNEPPIIAVVRTSDSRLVVVRAPGRTRNSR